MIKRNILTDIANYSKLTTKQVEYIMSLIEKFICDAVIEAKSKEEDTICLDLGLSSITIDLRDGAWKSVPSQSMKESFAKSAKGDYNPFEEELSDIISRKLLALVSEVK